MAQLEEERNEFVLENLHNESSNVGQHHEVVCPFPLEPGLLLESLLSWWYCHIFAVVSYLHAGVT